jgi:aspergillopepsin I
MHMMLMDGSTRMTDVQNRWVYSSETPPQVRQNHNIYDPTLSYTSQLLPGLYWSITYGDGSSASGNLVYTDIVGVGGTVVGPQAVELVEEVTGNLVGNPLDGMLGLAFSSLNEGVSGLMFAGS